MKRIVIIGPESTGKSTLCQQLAEHYDTKWCPEYAREYLSKKGMNYTYEDLAAIAFGHIELQKKLEAEVSNNIYFIDTDMYVMKVWCEIAFNSCHTWILKQIAARNYDLLLLCDTDLPWVKDDLREYPDLHTRQKLFKMYKDLLINQSTKWAIISGSYAERLQVAVSIIKTMFGK
jgi:NadR type nicotinamide-nucleotide adenylyltransferase